MRFALMKLATLSIVLSLNSSAEPAAETPYRSWLLELGAVPGTATAL